MSDEELFNMSDEELFKMIKWAMENQVSFIRCFTSRKYTNIGNVDVKMLNTLYNERFKVNENTPVDTPVMVKSLETDEWIPRYFAKIENGNCYAWYLGGTSFTTKEATRWAHMRLATEEEIRGER